MRLSVLRAGLPRVSTFTAMHSWVDQVLPVSALSGSANEHSLAGGVTLIPHH